ncbi:hypothetical protein FACS1894152_2240 [Bacilli bacterium]|nr:hypothetical protein FACS1894152_2240 [Bacilli bacterium]
MKNIHRKDGTFVIHINKMPYHTIPSDRYFEAMEKEYKEHPENFEEEVEPPAPSLELLKSWKKCYLKQARDKYKEDWGYSDNIYNNLKDGLMNDPAELQKYRDFLRELIVKYDSYNLRIDRATTKEELDSIKIEF